MPETTTSPTLFITSTAEQQSVMTEGFIDRTIYKLLFKPLELNKFHKVTEYVIKKTLCEPSIYLHSNNSIYLNHVIANESVSEILKRMCKNVSKKGQQNYIQNNKLMKTLRVAIRDSKNINKVSKYQESDQKTNNSKRQLWYFK